MQSVIDKQARTLCLVAFVLFFFFLNSRTSVLLSSPESHTPVSTQLQGWDKTLTWGKLEGGEAPNPLTETLGDRLDIDCWSVTPESMQQGRRGAAFLISPGERLSPRRPF